MTSLHCNLCAAGLFVCSACEEVQCINPKCPEHALSCDSKNDLQVFSTSMDNLAERLVKLSSIVPPPDTASFSFDSFVKTVQDFQPYFPTHQAELQEMLSILGTFKTRLAEMEIDTTTPLLSEQNIGLPRVLRPTDPQTPLARVASTLTRPWFLLTSPLTALNVYLQYMKFTYSQEEFKKEFDSTSWWLMVANTIIMALGLIITYTLNDPMQRFLTSARHLLPSIETELKRNFRQNSFNSAHNLTPREPTIVPFGFEWSDSTMSISKKIEEELPWSRVDPYTVSVQVLQNFSTAFFGKPVVEIRFFENQI